MIISDLSHFEEVVTEVPSILGGSTTVKTTAAAVVDKDMLNGLSPKIVSLLKSTPGTVTTSTVETSKVSASTKAGKFKRGDLTVKVSKSHSKVK